MLKAALMVAAAVCLIAGAAQAQSPQAQSSWPNKPVKILVPTAAGGSADNTARMFAAHLSKVLGQQFYIENRGGAGNTLGIESVARSPADGYTLLLGAGTITINHIVYKKLPYDVLRDLDACDADDIGGKRAGGASVAADEDAGRLHRRRQGCARQDQLRICRRR